MKVTELTIRQPVTIDVAADLSAAAETMAAQGVGALIVLDHDRPVGIVTDRDLVTRGVAKHLATDARVDAVMSMGLIAVDHGAELEELMKVFQHHAVRRVPIVDHDRVVGVVSLDDLLVLFGGCVYDLTNVLAAQIMFPKAGDEPPAPTTN